MSKKLKQPPPKAPPANQSFKCNEDAYCVGLDACFDEVRVRTSQFYNTTTWTRSAVIPTLHAGEHKKKGILMNFCPFCGYSFHDEISKICKKKVKKK